ncbi:MAG: hypothetical protein QXO51_03305 [Halobacteria archaeon]
MAAEARPASDAFEIAGHPYPDYRTIKVALHSSDLSTKVRVEVARRDGYDLILEGEFFPYTYQKDMLRSFIPAAKVGEPETRVLSTGALYLTNAVKRKEIPAPRGGFGKKAPLVLEDKFKPLQEKGLCLHVVAPAVSTRLNRSALMRAPAHQHFIVYDNSEVHAVLSRTLTRKEDEMLRSATEDLPATALEDEMRPAVEVVHTDFISSELIGYTLGKLRPYTIAVVKEEYLDGPAALPRIRLLPADKLPGDAMRREEKKKKELVEESMLTR